MNQHDAIEHLLGLANPDIAEHSQRFFKTGEGEYGHGDQFLGIRVPMLRKAVKQFRAIGVAETIELLKSDYHEVRLFALLSLVDQFGRSDDGLKAEIYRLYLQHTQYINNWDLVDSSCHQIVGGWLIDKDRAPLYQLARADCLWQKRIAMITTYHFIKQQQFDDTLALAELLLNDSHDLIHKAVGWMLREVGNRDRATEVAFLNQYYKTMPRTMLRYAIEKFDKPLRQAYLQGEV